MTWPDLLLDPDRSNFISIFGRKGSGKSELAKAYARAYPGPILLIDSTADVGDLGGLLVDFPSSPPDEWPTEDGEQLSVRVVPDRLSPSSLEDVDRWIGLRYFASKGDKDRRVPATPAMIFVDELREVARANRVKPHFDLVLNQGRHAKLTLLMCGPRTVGVDPLVLGQSDLAFFFALPHEADQERAAATLGIPVAEFAGLVNGLGEHEFLGFEQSSHELAIFPPLVLR